MCERATLNAGVYCRGSVTGCWRRLYLLCMGKIILGADMYGNATPDTGIYGKIILDAYMYWMPTCTGCLHVWEATLYAGVYGKTILYANLYGKATLDEDTGEKAILDASVCWGWGGGDSDIGYRFWGRP